MAALGLYYSNMQEWERAEEHYRKSLELNPNYPLAHEWLSAVLVGTRRFEEGTEEVLMAERLDPLSLRPKVLSAWTLYQARNYELALTKARELERLSPNFMQSHLQLANVLGILGDTEGALAHTKRAVELEPNAALTAYPLCTAYVRSGMIDEAQAVYDRWVKIAETSYVPPLLSRSLQRGPWKQRESRRVSRGGAHREERMDPLDGDRAEA